MFRDLRDFARTRADEGPQLEPLPAPRKFYPFNEKQDLAELKRTLERLRSARQPAAVFAPEPLSLQPEVEETEEELGKLRQRLQELVVKLAARTAQTPPPPLPRPEVPLVKPVPTETVKPPPPPVEKPVEPPPAKAVSTEAVPLDTFSLGNSLFSLGDFESALKAYRQINLHGLRAEERVPVQFLIATCLRQMGKTDEAANLYREVAASRGDEFFADCARWQVASIRWKLDMETRLKEVQARRQAAGGNK